MGNITISQDEYIDLLKRITEQRKRIKDMAKILDDALDNALAAAKMNHVLIDFITESEDITLRYGLYLARKEEKENELTREITENSI